MVPGLLSVAGVRSVTFVLDKHIGIAEAIFFCVLLHASSSSFSTLRPCGL